MSETRIGILDTPGFDDSGRTDTEILEHVARALTARHDLGWQLKGTIYLHRIIDVRYGQKVKYAASFDRLIGLSIRHTHPSLNTNSLALYPAGSRRSCPSNTSLEVGVPSEG